MSGAGGMSPLFRSSRLKPGAVDWSSYCWLAGLPGRVTGGQRIEPMWSTVLILYWVFLIWSRWHFCDPKVGYFLTLSLGVLVPLLVLSLGVWKALPAWFLTRSNPLPPFLLLISQFHPLDLHRVSKFRWLLFCFRFLGYSVCSPSSTSSCHAHLFQSKTVH